MNPQIDSESLIQAASLEQAWKECDESLLDQIEDEVITMESEEPEESEGNSVKIWLKVSSYDRFPIEVGVPDGLTKAEAEFGIQDILEEVIGNSVQCGNDAHIEVIEEEVERELQERRREYIEDCPECGTTKVVNENTGDIFCPACRRKNKIG